MKNGIAIFIAILLGIALGFFGVFNSVFTDGGLGERLVTIVAILLIYAGLGALWGFASPERPWRWVLALSLPGLILLGLYMLKEFNPFYLLYMVSILCLSSLGVYGGHSLRMRK